MLNVVLYPYSDRWRWLLEQKETEFQSVKAVIPKGWFIEEKSIKEGIMETDFESELIKSDCLWVVDSELELDFENYIKDKIMLAVNHGKQVLCTRKLAKEEETKLRDLVPPELWITEFPEEEMIKKRENELYDIDVPVVYIIGVSKEVNSVEQYIKLKHALEKEYKIILFSDTKEVELFDNCYWLSMFWSDKILDQSERMIKANHFIKEIETRESPDIILIGMTSGLSYFGRKVVENFGLHAYGLSKVVKPDCVITNVFCGNYDIQMLSDLGAEIKNIVGIEPDYFNMVNKCIEPGKSEIEHKICTVEVGEEIVERYVKQFDKEFVYHTLGESEYIRLSKAIIDKLEGYADICSI